MRTTNVCSESYLCKPNVQNFRLLSTFLVVFKNEDKLFVAGCCNMSQGAMFNFSLRAQDSIMNYYDAITYSV
jgi:hypothetical protein